LGKQAKITCVFPPVQRRSPALLKIPFQKARLKNGIATALRSREDRKVLRNALQLLASTVVCHAEKAVRANKFHQLYKSFEKIEKIRKKHRDKKFIKIFTNF
jgi:hypothetical protein